MAEAVSRSRNPQLQVSENVGQLFSKFYVWSDNTKLKSTNIIVTGG